jgi:hypothetical protein
LFSSGLVSVSSGLVSVSSGFFSVLISLSNSSSKSSKIALDLVGGLLGDLEETIGDKKSSSSSSSKKFPPTLILFVVTDSGCFCSTTSSSLTSCGITSLSFELLTTASGVSSEVVYWS